jgi:hypothetical protein
MKRMLYLAGAAGLAPTAFGMAIAPGVAHAATASDGATGHAKTVSLHHIARNGVTATQATSSSTSSPVANSPASPAAAGCKGDTEFTIPKKGNVKGHGWYKNNHLGTVTCIGTVEVSLHFTKGTTANPFCKRAILNMISEPLGPGGGITSSTKLCGTAGHSKVADFAVHTTFTHLPGSYVRVCAASTYNTGGTCHDVGS